MESSSKEFTLDPHILHKRLTKAMGYIFHLFAALKDRDAEVRGLAHANASLAKEIASLKLEIAKRQARKDEQQLAYVPPALTAPHTACSPCCDRPPERMRGRALCMRQWR